MRTLGSRFVRSLLLAAVALLSSGCFTARYLAQAGRGELDILCRARPIPEVVSDDAVPERIKGLILSVGTIKAYGETQGLRPTRNYESYADLHRPAAVWVVQGCAPLAFQVRHWKFPIVGTVPYLGFFDERAAHRFAASLAREEELDVDVRGASAFSTLGWFSDPILSTMIPSGEEALGELANAVLHESVHATIYVKDQSAFDESLASFVADRLTATWLIRVRGRDAPATRTWIALQARGEDHRSRLHRAHDELDAVYRSNATDAEKRAEKHRILEALRAELHLAGPINNATLAGYETYGAGYAAFERLLATCGGSWPRFLGVLASVCESDFSRPQLKNIDEVIDRLAKQGCRGQPRPVAQR